MVCGGYLLMYICVAVSGVWWIPTNVSVCGCEWCVVDVSVCGCEWCAVDTY